MKTNKNFILKNRNLLSRKDISYYFIGVFFLMLQLVLVLINKNAQNYDIFYWFCNHVTLILGIAFIFRKIDIIKSMVNVGFLAQFFWTMDFFSKLVFDIYIFKFTDYVFEAMTGAIVAIPILIHIFSTNIAFYFTYEHKTKSKVLLYSFIYLAILYLVTILFTPNSSNINCVSHICGFKEYTFIGYNYLWVFIVFLVVIVPTHLIQWWAYILNKKT